MKFGSFARCAKLALVIGLAATLGVPGAGAAPGDTAARPSVVAQMSVDKTGKAHPGDVLTYTVTLTNKGTGAATGLTAVDPIPHGTAYVRGSAASVLGRTEYSADGGKTWSALPLVASADKGKTWRPAPAADYALLKTRPQELHGGAVIEAGTGRQIKAAHASQYSHVRWLLKDALLPGGRANLSLKVVVL